MIIYKILTETLVYVGMNVAQILVTKYRGIRKE